MRYLIAALFSAALIYLAPQTQATPSQLNNSTTAKPTAKANTVQARQPEQLPQANYAVAEEKAQTEPLAVVEPIRKLSPHESLMAQAGIPESDWNAVNYIVHHESSWNARAINPSSGSYGLCQALPASKMASAGGDYRTNPVTQLKWCHKYSLQRYGGWKHAAFAWSRQQWW